MGGINTLSGLNKVSVDYRPTVELIKPKTNDSDFQISQDLDW